MEKKPVGTIGWMDLTVPDADMIRDFYGSVTGWKSQSFNMGEYSDYVMIPPDSEDGITGICHAKGTNASLPPQWLIYIFVENLDSSMSECVRLGGAIIAGPKSIEGQGKYCVIKDPAGAHCALFEQF